MDSHEDTTVLPLHTVEVDDRAKLNLPYTIIYIFAIMALIYHRLLHLLNSPDLLSFSLFLAMLIAELVFTFVWALTQALKFRPLRRRTFPERLAGKFDDKEFPSIDVFVCTADPLKEPPISVVNTTLSAMAFDYPAEKLSVYVSDDGGSELTLFAFMEAARFAKHWLPFCKEHGIETRCPQAYFSGDCSDCRVKERERMKLMYKKMEEKIESIMRRGSVTSDDIIIKEEHDVFRKWTSSFTRQHHPTIIQIGFRYGVLVEDFFTGYCLYRQGWRTIYCNETKPAFLGNTPINLNDSLSQYKRWMLGLFEVGFSRHCPLSLTLGNLSMVSVLMGMCYAYYSFWGITAIPVTIYAIIPQLTLANGISIFPKVSPSLTDTHTHIPLQCIQVATFKINNILLQISDPWFYLYLFLFMCSCGQELVEHLKFGGTFHRWWNYQRMWMIKAVSPNLFALGEFFLKLIGMVAVEFNVTSKAVEDEQRQRYEQEKFEFGVASPFFMPLATIAIISLVSFTRGLARVVQQEGNLDKMFVQLFISGFAMVNSWPIYDAMLFRRDKGKMPLIITAMSIFLACVLCFLGDLILMRFEP